ncbi:phosphotransferase [Brevibacterium pigmentatum]
MTKEPLSGGHGDLTPWNLLLGERWVFIDWDSAAASARLWDL